MPTTEFGSLTLDERWVEPSPERMLEWFVTTSRHRFRLVLEDLRDAAGLAGRRSSKGRSSSRPRSRRCSVAPDQALFLIPDRAEQEARLLARGPMPGTSDGVRAGRTRRRATS